MSIPVAVRIISYLGDCGPVMLFSWVKSQNCLLLYLPVSNLVAFLNKHKHTCTHTRTHNAQTGKKNVEVDVLLRV